MRNWDRALRLPRIKSPVLFIAAVLLVAVSAAQGAQRPPKQAPKRAAAALIRAGEFAPQFGLKPGQTSFPVDAFRIDRVAVTVADFNEFLKTNPEWRPGRVSQLLADSGYSQRAGVAQSPVTHVSWHAAQAYCEWQGGRLPTTLEWEYVAAADATKPDASRDPEVIRRILEWYSHSVAENPGPVGKGAPNYWGVRDLHGLVWEWTADFNSLSVNGDNRQDGDKESSRFCGASADTAANRENYAAFMRYAMRGSLRGEFTLPSLGFRCAYDLTDQERKGLK